LILSWGIVRVSACLFEILRTIVRILPSNKVYGKVSVCVSDNNGSNSRVNSIKI